MMKKNIFKLPLFLFVVLFAVASCDYVDEEDYITGGGGTNVKDTVRKVLLEDFTGHTCVNCPAAHETAKDILDFYGNQVVLVAVHAGYFAETDQGTFSYDFRTTMGTEIHDSYGQLVLPKGTVNRTPPVGTTSPILEPVDWSSETARHLSVSEEPDAYIRLNVSFDAADSTIDVATETTFFSENTNARKYNLVVAVTEDKIIKPQDTKDHGKIYDYEHNHVLRGGVTGTWGDEIHNGSVSDGQMFTKDYSNYKLGGDWNPDNCHVIAYLYYADGPLQGQVIQAQEVSVK